MVVLIWKREVDWCWIILFEVGGVGTVTPGGECCCVAASSLGSCFVCLFAFFLFLSGFLNTTFERHLYKLIFAYKPAA